MKFRLFCVRIYEHKYIYFAMKEFLKYLGAIIVLGGAAILAVYYFGQSNSNTYLAAAGVTMIVGFFVHIIINKNLK